MVNFKGNYNCSRFEGYRWGPTYSRGDPIFSVDGGPMLIPFKTPYSFNLSFHVVQTPIPFFGSAHAVPVRNLALLVSYCSNGICKIEILQSQLNTNDVFYLSLL